MALEHNEETCPYKLQNRELLDTLDLLTEKLESEGETHPFVGLARGVVRKYTEKRKCDCECHVIDLEKDCVVKGCCGK